MVKIFGNSTKCQLDEKKKRKWRPIFRPIQLKRKGKCYHQWRYFNCRCQECSEFGHGVMVHHCFKCDKLWDIELGFWTQDDINNVFFNEFFKG